MTGNGNDSGNTKYCASLTVAGVTYAATLDLRYYVSTGKGFETPTFNEIAYRSTGSTGLNFGFEALAQHQRRSRREMAHAGRQQHAGRGDRGGFPDPYEGRDRHA